MWWGHGPLNVRTISYYRSFFLFFPFSVIHCFCWLILGLESTEIFKFFMNFWHAVSHPWVPTVEDLLTYLNIL